MTFPAVPLGNQWVHPTLEADADLNAKIDVQLNALRTKMLAVPGSGMDHLYVVLRAAVTLANPIPFDTVVTDSASAWNASTHVYTVPHGGLWMVEAQIRYNSAIFGNVNINGLSDARHAPNGITQVGGGSRIGATVWRIAAGATISVTPALSASGTNQLDATGDSTYLRMERISD